VVDEQHVAFDGVLRGHVQETFLLRLRDLGVSDSVATTMTVDNPRRVLELPEAHDRVRSQP
jgi:predicted metal-dependent phosphotriesterase family hydrolase